MSYFWFSSEGFIFFFFNYKNQILKILIFFYFKYCILSHFAVAFFHLFVLFYCRSAAFLSSQIPCNPFVLCNFDRDQQQSKADVEPHNLLELANDLLVCQTSQSKSLDSAQPVEVTAVARWKGCNRNAIRWTKSQAAWTPDSGLPLACP